MSAPIWHVGYTVIQFSSSDKQRAVMSIFSSSFLTHKKKTLLLPRGVSDSQLAFVCMLLGRQTRQAGSSWMQRFHFATASHFLLQNSRRAWKQTNKNKNKKTRIVHKACVSRMRPKTESPNRPPQRNRTREMTRGGVRLVTALSPSSVRDASCKSNPNVSVSSGTFFFFLRTAPCAHTALTALISH